MSEEKPAPAEPLLNRSQRVIVAYAIAMLALLGTIAMGVYSLILLGQLVGFFSSVIWPIAVAGVMALILRPLIEMLEIKLKFRRTWAVVLLYGIFLCAVAALLIIALPPLIDQLLNFVAYLPQLGASTSEYFETHYPRWSELAHQKMNNPLVKSIAEAVANEGKSLLAHTVPALRSAGGGVLGMFALITHLAIIPVYLFFFLLIRGEPTGNLPSHLVFLKPSLRDDLVFLIREFISIVESFFRGQLIIGMIMGLLLGTGFTIIGLRFGFVIGLTLGVLNIIPYLGTIIGVAITLPLAFFQPEGGLQLVLLVMLVKGIVQAIESWFLTPRIMGSRTGLHPVMIIIAIFFWGKAFGGILGMLLAIPLTAFFVTAWRLAKWKYFTVREETKITSV
jgi:predicted PurR-regulated permease PerM